MSSNFRFLHAYNLSVFNLPIFLLMYPGSVMAGISVGFDGPEWGAAEAALRRIRRHSSAVSARRPPLTPDI